MSKQKLCCYIRDQTKPSEQCQNEAEWEINNESPDRDPIGEYTDACTAHVGELLTDAPVHWIYPIRKPEKGVADDTR